MWPTRHGEVSGSDQARSGAVYSYMVSVTIDFRTCTEMGNHRVMS